MAVAATREAGSAAVATVLAAVAATAASARGFEHDQRRYSVRGRVGEAARDCASAVTIATSAVLAVAATSAATGDVVESGVDDGE